MNNIVKFGPGGNSDSFFTAGLKHTYQIFNWLAEKQLDAYEYQAGSGIYGSDETFKNIGVEALKNNITVSLHAPYYISLSSPEEAKLIKNIEYIKKSIKAAELMQGYLIVVHPGGVMNSRRQEAINLTKTALYKTLEAVDDTKIKIGLETMGKINQLGTLEEILDLCSIGKKLRPVVDFGHLNARNSGRTLKSADDYKRIFGMILKKLSINEAEPLHCHFSKIEYTKSGEKKHLTFEDAIYGPEYELFIETLYTEKLNAVIICESDGTMTEDALLMKNYYDSLKI